MFIITHRLLKLSFMSTIRKLLEILVTFLHTWEAEGFKRDLEGSVSPISFTPNPEILTTLYKYSQNTQMEVYKQSKTKWFFNSVFGFWISPFFLLNIHLRNANAARGKHYTD